MQPLALPPPNSDPLAASPLKLVVCQVRHELVADRIKPREAIKVRQLLSHPYPQVSQQPATAVNIGPEGITQEIINGSQLRDETGEWTITLNPGSFSLETSAYTTWGNFRSRLGDLTTAVLKILEPALEERIGLRYVDEITLDDVSEPTEWKGWIRDELLGPLTHPDLGPAVSAAQQILTFDAGNGYTLTLRHGCAVDAPEVPYLLDHDCARQGSRELTLDDLLSTADDLNDIALRVFQASITPALYGRLKKKP